MPDNPGAPIQGSLTSDDLKTMTSNDYLAASASITGSLTNSNLKDKNGNYYREYNFRDLDNFNQLTFDLTRPAGTNGVTYLSLINATTGAVVAEGNNELSNGQAATSFSATTFPGSNYKIRISNQNLGGYTLSIVDGGRATSIVSNLPKTSLIGYFEVGTVGASGKYFPLAGSAENYKLADIALSPDGQLYGVGPATGVAQSYLYRIDPTTNQANQVDYAAAAANPIQDAQGNVLNGSITSLGFTANNLLYATESTTTSDELYSIDPTTSIATLVGQLPAGFRSSADLVYDPANNRFLAISLDTSTTNNALWQIPLANPTTATKIGLIGSGGIVGLNFANGQLTAFSSNTNGTINNQISINPATGAGTVTKLLSGIAGVSGATTIRSSTIRNDFNNDGKSDILWRNTDGRVALWQMNGATVVSGNYLIPTLDNSWKIASTGDFNNDGKSDILWRNTDGRVALWQMNGATVVSGNYLIPTLDNSWKIASTGDFNNDGKSDILWRNTDGRVALWKMDGATVVSSNYLTPILSSSWKVASTGDFDGDGKADILWRNDNGTTALWKMDGATVVSGNYLTPTLGNSWKVASTGDFDGDGKADILWRNDDGTTALWKMDGATVVAGNYLTAALDSSWKVAGTADFNGDGKADILWRNDNGTNALWTMNGATVLAGNYVTPTLDSSWQVAAPIL